MKNKPYKRKPGDLEIRILKNGRVIMITPDETLLEVAQIVDPNNSSVSCAVETKENGGNQTNKKK